VLVFSLLTVVFVQLCETPNSNRFELFPEAKKHQSKTPYRGFHEEEEEEEEEAAHSRVTTAANLFLRAVAFLFPSFVEFRVLDLSFAICVYTRAYVEFCVLGGFPFRNRN